MPISSLCHLWTPQHCYIKSWRWCLPFPLMYIVQYCTTYSPFLITIADAIFQESWFVSYPWHSSPSLARWAHLRSWLSNLWRYLAQSVSHDLRTFSPFLHPLCTFNYDISLFSLSTSSTFRYLRAVCTTPVFVPLVHSSSYCTFCLPSYSPLLLICFHLHI